MSPFYCLPRPADRLHDVYEKHREKSIMAMALSDQHPKAQTGTGLRGGLGGGGGGGEGNLCV